MASAKRLGVNECTITNWEKNQTTPRVRSFPRIISFLRYVPRLGRGETLGERLLQFRRILGITQKDLASPLHLYPMTLGRWERNEKQPKRKLKEHYARFLRELLNEHDSL